MNFAKQILAIEPILINSAEFNFAIWGKNWEKNFPVKLLIENLWPQTFQLLTQLLFYSISYKKSCEQRKRF